jgi:hypothetical protein
MSQALLNDIKATMRPLVARFDLKIREEEDVVSHTAVLYANETTGLKIAVEWLELRPFVTMYELKDGTFPESPITTGGERGRIFDVDDLLMLRPVVPSPVGKMLSGPDEHLALKLIAEYVRAVEEQAADVLSGDFSIFGTLDQIIKKRAQSMRVRQE